MASLKEILRLFFQNKSLDKLNKEELFALKKELNFQRSKNAIDKIDYEEYMNKIEKLKK